MAQAPKKSKAKNKEMTDDSESYVRMLHDAAIRGDRKKLEKILKSGMNADHPNSLGQTPLFLACFEGQRRLAKLLLKHGANPNARNLEGSTPVHAASFTADVKLFGHLLDAGGDLRLHDNSGRSPRDWAARQPNIKKRKSFMDFIDEIRSMANYSYGMAPSNRLCVRNPAFQKFQKRQWSFQKKLTPLFQNFGYGLVHEGKYGYDHAVRGYVPVIPESHLKHDNAGPTYNNGQFMVMESMLWKNVPVTVKRLHRTLPAEEATVDLLIQELEFVSCLQHPNILLLLAACQNNAMEGMVLLYEKVRCGSLDAHLYQRGQTLAEKDIYKIFYQISSGLVYLHQRGIVHCCITSHAIQLILPNYAKLSNFEYARTRVSRNRPYSLNMLPKYAYNWMAPELLSGQQNVMEEFDVYSLTAILWEVLSGTPPWCGKQPDDIVMELVTNKHSLPLDSIHSPFDDLLVRGLNLDPADRITDIVFRDLLWQGLRTNAGDPQMESNDRQSSPVPTNLNGLTLSASSMYNARPTSYAVYHSSGQGTEIPTLDSKFASKTSENERLADYNFSTDLPEPQSLKKTGSLGGPMDTRKLEQMMDRLVELEKSERPNQRLNVPHPSPNEQAGTDESDEDLRCMNADEDEPDQLQLVDTSQRQEDLKIGQFTAKRTRQKFRNLECEGDAWKISHEIDMKGQQRTDLTAYDQYVYSIHKMEMDKGFAKSQSGGDSGSDAAVGERSNPFLDKELKRQSEEICRQLLSQPIRKLPIPQKLITGRCDGESVQKPTVYGTLLRDYSQNRQGLAKGHGIRPPTFGISLTELKAAVLPRALSSGRGAFRHHRDTNYYSTLQPGLNISSSYQSTSKSNLNTDNKACTFKPASHREPSLNISPSKRSACPLQNFAIPPASSSGGISSASYIVQGAESLGGESAVGFRQTFPRRTSYNIMSMASYDHPDRNDSDADMIRFKSDPLLQRKIYLREFARAQIQPGMLKMQGQVPYHVGESLEDLEEDDNLEELIGKNWDRPQQAGSLPPRHHSWWNDPSVGWTGSSQDRFTLDKTKKYLIREADLERQINKDGNQRYLVKEEDSERQRNRDGSQRHTIKEEDSERQRNKDGSQRHSIREEDLKKERYREQDKRHLVKEGDSQRVINRDKDRHKHGDAEHDRTQETRCHFCEQELSALTPKTSQLSRIDSSTKQSIKSAVGRKDSKAETKVREETSLIGGKQKNDWPMVATGPKQRAADGNATDLEDFYFDDDLHSSSLYKEKYMRLQSTMAMDTNSLSTPHALSSFTSPIYGSQRSATAVASSSSERERLAGIQIAGKSIPGSTSGTKSLEASTSSRKSATCPEKWLMASHVHNMSTITVESDSQGHHRICLKKIDPLTGAESTTYKASVVADQVITQVFLSNQDDHNDDQAKDDVDDDDVDDDEGGDSGSSSSDSEKPYPV